jgi:protein TonB
MNVEARAFGASLALHGGVLLAILWLGGGAARAPGTPRVIDLRLLESQAAVSSTSVVAAPPPRQERVPASPAVRPLPPPTEPAARPVAEPPPPPDSAPTEVARTPELPPVPALASDPGPAPPAATSEDADAAPAAVVGPEAVARAAAGVGAGDAGVPPAGQTATAAATGAGPAAGAGSRADAVPAGPATTAAVPDGIPGGGGSGVPRDLAALRDMVQRRLGYPGLARRMGWEGRVTLSFVVCPDGRARDVAVVESSGRELLDQCAVDSVRKLTGLPASTAEAKVIVPLVYRLH